MNKSPVIFCALMALLATGCVNPTASTIRETKADPTYVAPKPPLKAVLPKKDPDAYRTTDSGRNYSLTLKNADIRDVLLLLSKESGIPIVGERGLTGTVRIEAQNKKLGELLYAILKPLGYTASVENGIIMVGRPKLTTRTYRLNYIKDKRTTSSNLTISASSSGNNSSSSGSGGGSGGSGGSGSSSSSSGNVNIKTEGVSDFWGALENSLEMMVFGSSSMGKREGGAYIRGESEKKAIAEKTMSGSSQVSGRYSQERGMGRQSGTSSGRYGETSNYDDSIRTTAQTTDVEDPMLLNLQIVENKLKQLVVNEIAGIIQITDYPDNLDRIATFLADVEEGSKRQVLIQAHIMEVTLRDSLSLGVNWSKIIDKNTLPTIAQTVMPTNQLTNVLKITAGSDDFAILVDAMKEQGNVNMLSSPKIAALNSQKAVIKLTTKQVSWVSTKTTNSSGVLSNDTYTTTPQVDEVGIFLDVTPQISPDGIITMQIHPSVSEIKEMSVSPDKTSNKPVIDIREIDTMIDVRVGETIVIAGLISDKLTETKQGVPLLSDIPIFGGLFAYNKQDRKKTELVIMLTPYLLNAKTIEEIRREHEKRMQNIGETFHLINNLGSMITEKGSRDWYMKTNPPFMGIPETLPQPTQPPAVAPSVPSSNPATESNSTGVPRDRLTVLDSPSPPQAEAKPDQHQQEITQLREELKRSEDRLGREREEKERVLKESRQPALTDTTELQRQKSEIARLKDELKSADERLIREQEETAGIRNSQAVAAPLPLKPGEAPSVFPDASRQQMPQLTATARSPALQPSSSSLPGDSNEQSLYRAGVAAYKIRNCPEAIRIFTRFLAAYPKSYFAQDATVYRSDCEAQR